MMTLAKQATKEPGPANIGSKLHHFFYLSKPTAHKSGPEKGPGKNLKKYFAV